MVVGANPTLTGADGSGLTGVVTTLTGVDGSGLTGITTLISVVIISRLQRMLVSLPYHQQVVVLVSEPQLSVQIRPVVSGVSTLGVVTGVTYFGDARISHIQVGLLVQMDPHIINLLDQVD